MKKSDEKRSDGHAGSDSRAPTVFPSAREDAGTEQQKPSTPQTRSATHRLAYADVDFLMRDELRGTRLQLEFEKADLVQADHGIENTVVIFGSTRVPEPAVAQERLQQAEAAAAAAPKDADLARAARVARSIVDKAHYYEQARELARLITEHGLADPGSAMMVVTGYHGSGQPWRP